MMRIAEFHEWCKFNQIGYTITFSEGTCSDSIEQFEVETISPAERECIHMKRCYDFQDVVNKILTNITK